MTSPVGLGRPAAVLIAVYVVDAVVHLVAKLAGIAPLDQITQAIAMPLLVALLLLAGPRHRLVTLTAIAVFFSWLGDLLPAFVPADASFLVLVGCFFLAQIAYIAGFWPYRRDSVATRIGVIPYVVVYVVLLVLCVPKAGALLPPLIIYGLTLVGMAVLSTGLHPLTGVGGALFLISDALIALTHLDVVAFEQSGFVIMLTYLAAQLLIVLGVLRRLAAPRSLGSAVPQ